MSQDSTAPSMAFDIIVRIPPSEADHSLSAGFKSRVRGLSTKLHIPKFYGDRAHTRSHTVSQPRFRRRELDVGDPGSSTHFVQHSDDSDSDPGTPAMVLSDSEPEESAKVAVSESTEHESKTKSTRFALSVRLNLRKRDDHEESEKIQTRDGTTLMTFTFVPCFVKEDKSDQEDEKEAGRGAVGPPQVLDWINAINAALQLIKAKRE